MAFAALVAAAALAAAAAAPPAGDAVALLQRSLWGSQAGVSRHRRSAVHASAFRVGDRLEFRLAGSKWLNCTVVAPGRKRDSYDIHVPALAAGLQDLAEVPASSLRDPRKESARRAAKRQAEQKAADEKRRREAQEAVLFEDGEDVLMAGSGKGAGQWFPARIWRRGTNPGAYDVRFRNVTIANVRQSYLKKTHDMHYETCENVEVLGTDGIWRPTKVLGPGTDVGTANLRYPGSMTEVLHDIPVVVLRKVSKKANLSGADAAAALALDASGLSDALGENTTFERRAVYEANLSGADAAAALALEASGLSDALGENTTFERRAAYEVGQQLWVQLDGGHETKPWVPCSVVGLGDEPGLYNVRVAAKIPAYDLCDVPASRLRETQEAIKAREEEEARRRAEAEAKQKALEEAAEEAMRRKEEEEARQREEEARAELEERERAKARKREQAVSKIQSVAAYKEGQALQFNVHGSRWVNCTVTSLSLKPNTYNIFVPSFPKGLREIADVQAQALRSDADVARQLAEQRLAKRRAAEETLAKQERAYTFEPGEHVQVLAKGTNNTWAAAVITEKDAKLGWYWADVDGLNIRLHASVLRRDPEHEFDVGEIAQIRARDYANAWVPCTITGWGEMPGTYNIHFEHGPLGHRDMHNIDARALFRIKFSVGQAVEAYMKRGPSAGLWLKANVTRIVANKSDTYSLHVFDVPYEFNITNMPYKLIRRSEADAARLREELRQREEAQREQERQRAMAEGERREWDRSHTFEESESVQVLSAGKDAGSWINVTVLSNGSKPGTYNLYWKRRDTVFQNVLRRNIRKDPESQALRLKEAERAMKDLQEREAKRRAAVLARARSAEEAHRKAEERKKKAGEEGLDLEAEPDEAVESVSEEELARVVKMTEDIMQRDQERAAQASFQIHVKQPTVETRPLSEEEDFAKREAEWQDVLAEEEEPVAKPAARPSTREAAYANIMNPAQEGIDI